MSAATRANRRSSETIRRLRKLALTFATVIACFICCSTVSAVTITANSVRAAITIGGVSANNFFNGTDIPTTQLLENSNGTDYSGIQIAYSEVGDLMTFLYSFNQKRSGASSVGTVADIATQFTVDRASTYTISGQFNATDISTAGRLRLQTFFATGGTVLFSTAQDSRNTVNESLIIGGNQGDFLSSIFGSATGTLFAGQGYVWNPSAVSQAFPDADGGASATGFVRLDILRAPFPDPVPDSGSTVSILAISICALLVGKWILRARVEG